MIKSFVRAGVFLMIGAGLGIWFAPSNAREFLHSKIAVARGSAEDFNANVGSTWFSNAEKTLTAATKKVDLKKLNKEEFSRWMKSVQDAYATVSTQAVRTQQGIETINQYLKSASAEYQKHRSKLTELQRSGI